jgi:hypothetical protein
VKILAWGRSWLQFEYYKRRQSVATKPELDDAVALFEVKGKYQGTLERVFCRVAVTRGFKYLDLGG